MVATAYAKLSAGVWGQGPSRRRRLACFALRNHQDIACIGAIIALLSDVVTLYRAARWKIAVYGREHGVPHFHVEGPGFRCSVAIASFEVIVGSVPAAVLSEALAWARPHQALLLQTWQELNG